MARRVNLIRWTITEAAPEFGIDRATLTKRIKEASIECGEDGKYSTKQILAATFGDMDGEKLLLIREQRKSVENENRKFSRDWIPIKDAVRAWSSRVVAAKQAIVGSKLTEAEKRELLNHLAEIREDEYGEASTEEEEPES